MSVRFKSPITHSQPVKTAEAPHTKNAARTRGRYREEHGLRQQKAFADDRVPSAVLGNITPHPIIGSDRYRLRCLYACCRENRVLEQLTLHVRNVVATTMWLSISEISDADIPKSIEDRRPGAPKTLISQHPAIEEMIKNSNYAESKQNHVEPTFTRSFTHLSTLLLGFNIRKSAYRVLQQSRKQMWQSSARSALRHH